MIIFFITFFLSALSPKCPNIVILDWPPTERHRWHKASENISATGEAIVEWLPNGEGLESWTESLTAHFVPHKLCECSGSADVIVQNLYKKSLERFKKMTWTNIQSDKRDAIYSWSLKKGHRDHPPQYEIVRIAVRRSGVFTVAYTKKGEPPAAAEKQQWLRILRCAQPSL